MGNSGLTAGFYRANSRRLQRRAVVLVWRVVKGLAMAETRKLAAILAADVAGYSKLAGCRRGADACKVARAPQRSDRSDHRRASRASDRVSATLASTIAVLSFTLMGGMEAERRQVTVLFTDMVGFTTFSERVGRGSGLYAYA